MGYNLDTIKARLAKVSTSSGKGGGSGLKTKWFKPEIGKEYEIRVLPYQSSDGEPFQKVLFYSDLTKFKEKRMVSPMTFGMPDPVNEVFEVMRKDKTKWNIAKHLRPQEKVYAAIIDRAQEKEGVLIWEMSTDTRDEFYSTLLHKDNVDEDMMDVNTGYDWTVSVGQKMTKDGKPQLFQNKYPVRTFSVKARKKASKLSADKKQVEEWLAATPKFDEMFKAQLMSEEEMIEKMNAFIEEAQDSTGTTKEGLNVNEKNGVSSDEELASAEQSVDDAFKGLD